MLKIGFTHQEIFLRSLSRPFLVPEKFSSLKCTFEQFMFNCYNKENLLKDVKVDIRLTNTRGNVTQKKKQKLNDISYLKRMQLPTELHYNEMTNKDLVVRFNRDFKNAFEGLKNVFLSSCKSRCKILHLMRRKKQWVNKVVPTDAVKNPLIPVECFKGKGVVHLYECNFIVVDPDRKEELKLLDSYEYVSDMLVSLAIVEGLSRYDEMNLPSFKTDGLPNPAFHLDSVQSDVDRLVYRQGKLDVGKTVGKSEWMVVSSHWKLDKKSLRGICYPVLWFALQYGASPVQPQKDACHLEVDGEK